MGDMTSQERDSLIETLKTEQAYFSLTWKGSQKERREIFEMAGHRHMCQYSWLCLVSQDTGFTGRQWGNDRDWNRSR